MDLDALLAARASDGASGEDLEYDYDFMELQRVATPGEERQAGNDIIAGEEPDFRDVETRALSILERSHDLRAAVILANARLNTQGLGGFADGVAYIRRCLADHWDTCHPILDADDDNDPTMRVNAVRGLAGGATTQRYLRRTPLTQSRTFGRLNLLNIQQGYGETTLAEGQIAEYDRAGVNAAFSDTSPEALTATLTAAKQILSDLKAIDKLIGQKASGVDFSIDETIKIAQMMVRHIGNHVAGAPPEAEAASVADAAGADAEDSVAASAAPRRAGGGGGISGAVETAAEARAAIDRVIAYFKRCEPSSPVPLILERAKRLVGADFMAIMKDMAPQGLENVRKIGGLEDEY